jgi:hypothetical protein
MALGLCIQFIDLSTRKNIKQTRFDKDIFLARFLWISTYFWDGPAAVPIQVIDLLPETNYLQANANTP